MIHNFGLHNFYTYRSRRCEVCARSARDTLRSCWCQGSIWEKHRIYIFGAGGSRLCFGIK
nr:MAG TPA: hypothetical protein [Caudoviricetes sp.]